MQSMYDTIVVPVDLSPASLRSIDTAVRLARTWTVPVELVSVSSPGLEGTAEAELWQLLSDIDAPVRPPVSLPGNDVAAALMAHLRTLERPLLCMATHGRTAIGSVVLGSTARAVLDRTESPVVLVGPRCEVPERLDDIVIAVQPGSDGSAAIDEALRWASMSATHLHLLSVLNPGDATDEIGGRLASLAHDCRARGVAACWRVLDGGDVGSLLRVATAVRAAALVIGLRPNGVDRHVFGSVGRQLVRHATCPVLAVPHEGVPG